MNKLNLNFFLRSNFEYSLTNKTNIMGIELSQPYLLSYRYLEVDGEFDELYLDLIVFTSKSKFYLYFKNKIIKLKSAEDLKEFILPFNENKNFIYIIKSPLGYKIGKTKNVSNRGNIFNVKLPFNWQFYKIFFVKDYNKIEKFLHNQLVDYKLNGEWFDLDGESLALIDDFISQVP